MPSLVIAVFLIVFITSESSKADDVIIQKRMYEDEIPSMLDPKRKKPFCNAFTGCGRKRSDESMATLVDLNSEPAVEELSRQILSEAKLWEAIQEARAELLRRRAHQNERNFDTLQLTGLRKKRSAHHSYT